MLLCSYYGFLGLLICIWLTEDEYNDTRQEVYIHDVIVLLCSFSSPTEISTFVLSPRKSKIKGVS